MMTILDAIRDPALFGPWFRHPESWRSWRVFLAALFNLPLEDEKLYTECTGGRPLPQRQAREGYLIVGRRGGKSFIAALIAVFLACFRSYRLSPGERGVIMILAADRRQAKVIFRYARAFLENVAMLKSMIESITAESITLTNRIVIEVHTASFRSVRGYTICACLADEVAFWDAEDSANPDVEILNAVRPAMATVESSLLLCLSTHYSRRGALWSAYRKHFGKESDVFVWVAPTSVMNPSIPESVIANAYEEDSAAASSEYGATFRSDIESFVSVEAVEAATIPGRLELPPVAGARYHAFCDPAGGSGTDSFTLAVGHAQGNIAVLDLIRERKPRFSPEAVVQEFAADLKRYYGIYQVHGDKYAGEWPAEQFQKYGISYKSADKTKSELYQAFLPVLNSGKAELLDNKTLRTQLIGLERRTARSGKDSIDHGPNSHDDIANAAAGVLTLCTPFVELTAEHFARGTFSYFGKPNSEERNLWDQ